MKTYAILLANGSSTRAGQNKLQCDLFGRPLWRQAYESLNAHPLVDEVVIVGPDGVPGGNSWMQSFQAGLGSIAPQPHDLIVVHNAANPYLSAEEIEAVILAAKAHGAAAVSAPVVDTLMTTADGCYQDFIDRRHVRHMQTPQAARAEFVLDLPETTDLISALPIPAKVVDANVYNRKVTTPADLPLRAFLGQDSHRFSESGDLQLGGLTLSEHPAMQANSDGDVILHAIGRALAQAKGVSFSEQADALCAQGIVDSTHYLTPLLQGLRVHNVSIMLEGAQPKIDPIKEQLKSSLATLLKVRPSQISIAAMTGEDLSPFGKGEGLSCTCVITCS